MAPLPTRRQQPPNHGGCCPAERMSATRLLHARRETDQPGGVQVFYTINTEKSYTEAIDRLKQGLASVKFGVLWELDVPSKLQEKGADFTVPFRILEVCNPHHAKEALERNIMVGYFLPCRIVVYEQAGQVQIGMVRPASMVGLLEDEGLRNFAEQVERELMRAIDSAK